MAISRVVVKVGTVDRRLALLAVDKVVRGMCCRIPFSHLDTFQRMTIIRMKISWFIETPHQ